MTSPPFAPSEQCGHLLCAGCADAAIAAGDVMRRPRLGVSVGGRNAFPAACLRHDAQGKQAREHAELALLSRLRTFAPGSEDKVECLVNVAGAPGADAAGGGSGGVDTTHVFAVYHMATKELEDKARAVEPAPPLCRRPSRDTVTPCAR